MKNDLSCAVVRDLLPSYIDGLTADETNDALEAHLASCPDCARLHRQMTAPEDPAPAADREVDYLRKVRRKSRVRVALAVLATAVLVLGGLAAKVFLIGSPAGSDAMAWEVTETGGGIRVQVMSAASANAYWGWKLTREGEVLTITCREGLVSSFHPNGSGTVETAIPDGVTEVRLMDQVVWQDGTAIHRRVLAAWNARTPYVGDAPALGALAGALDIGGRCGSYTMALQTADRPYGWTLEFSDRQDPSREMEGLSIVMLALVDNLEEVRWTWEGQSRTVTLAEADGTAAALYARQGEPFPGSVKDCAASPAALQRLWNAVMT